MHNTNIYTFVWSHLTDLITNRYGGIFKNNSHSMRGAIVQRVFPFHLAVATLGFLTTIRIININYNFHLVFGRFVKQNTVFARLQNRKQTKRHRMRAYLFFTTKKCESFWRQHPTKIDFWTLLFLAGRATIGASPNSFWSHSRLNRHSAHLTLDSCVQFSQSALWTPIRDRQDWNESSKRLELISIPIWTSKVLNVIDDDRNHSSEPSQLTVTFCLFAGFAWTTRYYSFEFQATSSAGINSPNHNYLNQSFLSFRIRLV